MPVEADCWGHQRTVFGTTRLHEEHELVEHDQTKHPCESCIRYRSPVRTKIVLVRLRLVHGRLLLPCRC